MNEFVIDGRIGKINLQYADNGSCYCKVSIGIPNGKVSPEGKRLYDNFFVTFFNTKYRKTAERLSEEVKEGEYLRVRGKLTDNVFTPEGSDKPRHVIQLIGFGFIKLIFDEHTRRFVPEKERERYGEEEFYS